MKKVVLPKDDGFRLEPLSGAPNVGLVRRDYHEPLPVGTVIAKMFVIEGYDRDCDGSAMMRVAAVDKDGHTTGWRADCLGVYEDSMVVLDDAGELHRLVEK